MQNCAFDPAFWQALNSILNTRSKFLVSNWNPWYHDFFSSIAFAIPCNSCELVRAFRVYIREIKYLTCMSLQSAAPATEKHPVPLLDATLIQSVPLSPSAHHLTFRMENKDRLEFLPGQ